MKQIGFNGPIAVGDMVEHPENSGVYYAVLGINEDGIVVKKLDFEQIAQDVMNANSELLRKLPND